MKDLIGQRFGKLIVIDLDKNTHKNRRRYWICKCDCGNITNPISTLSLTSGNTKSCGCLKKIAGTKNLTNADTVINLSGQRFGKLVVLEKDNQIHKDGFAYWICKCDCGNITRPIRGTSLTNGHTKSCGCIKSLGNSTIKKILQKEKLNFIEEYSFKELKGNTRPLRFDFAVLNEDNSIKCLIEYQGQQHYTEVEYFGGEQQFKKQIKYDELKHQYCLKNNIKLIILSYKEYHLLNEEYLLNKIFD